MMPRTRAGLMEVSSPAISIVPANRNEEPIGVTATRASTRIEQIWGKRGGFGRVRLYPLPACIGSFNPKSRAMDADHDPPASTYSSAENEPRVVSTPSIFPALARKPL